MQNDIRKAGVEDIPVIQSLIQSTWQPTYRSILSAAQMDYMLDMMYSTEVLKKQLEEGHIFLLIYQEGRPGGFAGYEMDYIAVGTCKLHKLYVLPEMHGRKLGRKLFDAVKEESVRSGQQKLILNVNRYNKAADFYKKLGMEIAEEVDVAIGNGYFMNDYVMRLYLQGQA